MKKKKLKNQFIHMIFHPLSWTKTQGYKILKWDVNHTVDFYDQSIIWYNSNHNAFFAAKFTKKVFFSKEKKIYAI